MVMRFKKGDKVKIYAKSRGDSIEMIKNRWPEFPYGYYKRTDEDGTIVIKGRKNAGGDFFIESDLRPQFHKGQKVRIKNALISTNLIGTIGTVEWINDKKIKLEESPYEWNVNPRDGSPLEAWLEPKEATYKIGDKESEEESEVSTKTMAIKIGEKYVPMAGANCGIYNNQSNAAYIIITAKDDDDSGLEYDIYDKNDNRLSDCEYCFKAWQLEPYRPGHKKGLMKTLSIMAAKLLDADTKSFVEAGILDSELKITEEGRDFVLTQVLNDNKAKYASEARKIVAEEKKAKEGK